MSGVKCYEYTGISNRGLAVFTEPLETSLTANPIQPGLFGGAWAREGGDGGSARGL